MQLLKGIGLASGVGDGLLFKFEINSNLKQNIDEQSKQEEIEKFNNALLFLEQIAQDELENTTNKKRTTFLQTRLNFLKSEEYINSIHKSILNENMAAEEAIFKVSKESIKKEKYFSITKDEFYQATYVLAYVVSKQSFCKKILSNETRIVMATKLPIYYFMFEEIKHKLSCILMCENCIDKVAVDFARHEKIPVTVLSEADFDLLVEDKRTVTNEASGYVIQEPDSRVLSDLAQKRLVNLRDTRKHQMMQGIDAITQNGVRTSLTAETVLVQHARGAIDCDANAIGIVKSDYLRYSMKSTAEKELYNLYRDILILMGDKSVTIKCNVLNENSNELGIKYIEEKYKCLAYPDMIFSSNEQWDIINMRAILKSSPYGKPQILLCGAQSPKLVVDYKKELLKQTQNLRKDNSIISENIKIGACIRTPVSAAIADIIAEKCDFLFVDVGRLSKNIFTPEGKKSEQNEEDITNHPAVMRTIAQIARMAQHVNTSVTIGGYNIFPIDKAAFFMALRVNEICLLPSEIPHLKKEIRTLTREDCKQAMITHLQLPQ